MCMCMDVFQESPFIFQLHWNKLYGWGINQGMFEQVPATMRVTSVYLKDLFVINSKNNLFHLDEKFS